MSVSISFSNCLTTLLFINNNWPLGKKRLRTIATLSGLLLTSIGWCRNRKCSCINLINSLSTFSASMRFSFSEHTRVQHVFAVPCHTAIILPTSGRRRNPCSISGNVSSLLSFCMSCSTVRLFTARRNWYSECIYKTTSSEYTCTYKPTLHVSTKRINLMKIHLYDIPMKNVVMRQCAFCHHNCIRYRDRCKDDTRLFKVEHLGVVRQFFANIF